MWFTKTLIRLRGCAGRFFAGCTCTLQHVRPRGYKTFFMLNSAEHEICPANKYKITNICYSSVVARLSYTAARQPLIVRQYFPAAKHALVYASHILQRGNLSSCANISLLITIRCCMLIINCSKVIFYRALIFPF